MPNNCVEDQNCQALVTAVVIDGRFEFELKSVPSELKKTTKLSYIKKLMFSPLDNAAYVALAFSTDMIMGNDAGMECIPVGANVLAYSSWVIPRPSFGASRVDVVSVFTDILMFSYD